MKKVSIYIGGSNLYFSAKSKFNSKIDIEKLCKKLAGVNKLVEIKYYIAPIEQSSNPKMYAAQQSFFDKLRGIKNLKIIFGRLEKRKRDGKVYFVEKATDANLALDLVLDAQANLYDEAFLVSNDGDFSGAVKASASALRALPGLFCCDCLDGPRQKVYCSRLDVRSHPRFPDMRNPSPWGFLCVQLSKAVHRRCQLVGQERQGRPTVQTELVRS